MLDSETSAGLRWTALVRGAREWQDPDSAVRARARAALQDGEWPRQTVERALGNVLLDFETALAAFREDPPAVRRASTALAILPGNIIGPAIACAYCAALAGTNLILKSSHHERRLSDILVEQFDRLGPPLRGSLSAVYWQGGDESIETMILRGIDRAVVFGQDATVASIRSRVPPHVAVAAYGESFSIAVIAARADLAEAAEAVSWDVALFDQRGCMSPQTIYVEGGADKAVLFAQALSFSLRRRQDDLPRAQPDAAEKIALAETIRRLQVNALPAATHALGTMLVGPGIEGVPGFVVSVAPCAPPVCAGFGRIVVVMPCESIEAAADAARALGSKLETIGAAGIPPDEFVLLARAGARRICDAGAMQAPPFGYRPAIADFQTEQA